MVIYSNSIIKILCRGSSRVEGITLYPFIILRKEIKGTAAEVYVINHERIHIAQQAELLVLPFMAIYICEYMWGRIRGLTQDESYRGIRFEREAYYHMYDLRYLDRRKFLAYRKRWGGEYV